MRWKALGREIKRLREELGLSQNYVAAQSGAGKATVSRVENLKDDDPKRHLPGVETLQNILRVLKVESVGLFLRQFEAGYVEQMGSEKHDVSQPVTGRVDTQPLTGNPLAAEGHHGFDRLTLEVPRLTAAEARIWQHLGFVLNRVGSLALFSTANERAPSPEHGGGEGSHPHRRSSDADGGRVGDAKG